MSCPKISRLLVYSSDTANSSLWKEVEWLCNSYGANLVELKLVSDYIGRPISERICKASPNVLVHVLLDMDTETTIALGPAASKWTVRAGDENYTERCFASVGRVCNNLQGVHSFSETSFKGLSLLPKPRLRHLDVCVANVSCISILLQVLRGKVDSLEKLTYKGPSPELELVRLFVLSRKNLKTIQLHSRG